MWIRYWDLSQLVLLPVYFLFLLHSFVSWLSIIEDQDKRTWQSYPSLGNSCRAKERERTQDASTCSSLSPFIRLLLVSFFLFPWFIPFPFLPRCTCMFYYYDDDYYYQFFRLSIPVNSFTTRWKTNYEVDPSSHLCSHRCIRYNQ